MKIMDDPPREIEPLPVGTRVRHAKHSELIGTITRWEMHQSGALSAIPYTVIWDDQGLAEKLCGLFYWWKSDDMVVPIS